MASFKLNMAIIDNCPAAKELAGAIEEYGLPETEEFGVLNCTAGDQAVYATIIRKTHQAIQRLDAETGDLATTSVEKVTVLPVGIFPSRGILEVYEGPAGTIDQVAGFLATGLAMPTVVNTIDLDIPAAIEKLQKNTNRFQLKSIRVSEYAHNSYMIGPYAPKFLDTESGMDFLRNYADFTTSASVKFQGPAGLVTVTLSPKACFRYSLSNEDDKPHVQTLLRKLI